jgi:hypothetical protein
MSVMIREKSKFFLSVFLCGLLSILLIQAPASAGERIPKEMVLKHVIGLTWIGTTSGGSQYIAKLNKDGTLEVELSNSGAHSEGTWKVDDQGYMCQEYDAGWDLRCTRYEYIDKLPGIVGYTKEGGAKSYIEKSEHGNSFFERRVLGKLRQSEKQPAMTEAPKPEKSGQKTPDTDRPAESGSENSITDRLKALKKLEDAGLISKEEAAAKRKEIMKNL